MPYANWWTKRLLCGFCDWWTSCTALKTPHAFCIEKPLCSSDGQIFMPRPHPLHHIGLNASRRSNGERSMTITQQWSNPPIPAWRKPLISSYEPLPCPFKLNLCFRWLFNGITICGEKFKYDLGTHLTMTENTHWREPYAATKTCHTFQYATYNLFLSNNVQNVTFMN